MLEPFLCALGVLARQIPAITISLNNHRRNKIAPQKSIFNKIIGDSQLELDFAHFLEGCNDVISYVKNYMAVNFRIDYVNADGNISNYDPDFIVKKSENKIYRLKQWCEDVNQLQKKKYLIMYLLMRKTSKNTIHHLLNSL